MSETTREGLNDAEAGDKMGASLVKKGEQKRPEDAEAVEQTRSDGPPGRGLDR